MIEAREITDRAEWLQWRQDYLCASEIGAAAGIDHFKSPLQLYAEKTLKLKPQADNASMRRGRLFEGAAIEYIREENPDWRIERPNIFLSDNETRLACTPDALTEDAETGALVDLQIKVISRPVFERWNGVPPLGYQLQVLCEAMLLGAAWGLLAVLVVSNYSADLHLFKVPRHAAAEARVRRIAVEFWDRVASGRRPPMDYARDADVVTAMFPASVPGPVLDLTGNNRLPELLRLRTIVKAEIADRQADIDSWDTEIKATLGANEVATLPGWKLSWKTEERKEYTVAASTRRVLRVTATDVEEEQAA